MSSTSVTLKYSRGVFQDGIGKSRSNVGTMKHSKITLLTSVDLSGDSKIKCW